MIGRAPKVAAGPDDSEVWMVDLATTGAELVGIYQRRGLLTEAERARAGRIADPGRRDDWIAAHVALHLALSDHLGAPAQFLETGGGKPRIADFDGDFSLTHSGRIALIAVRARGRVGIDAEVRRAAHLGEERRRLIEEAGAAALPGTPLPGDAEIRFLAAWTRLEAIGKMRGTGIGALLEAIGIVARGPGADAVAENTRRLVNDEVAPTGLIDIDVGRFDAVAAIATSPPAGPPASRDLAAELSRLVG